jgi:hypothetical protein
VFGKQNVRKSIALALTMALFFVTSMVALAGTKNMAGDITVRGQVSINGQTAVSNSTIFSASSIATGADSSAIIYLGKNGRVEVLSGSSLTITFTETSITGTLSNGNVRVANAPGVETTLTTSNSTVIADSAQANTFSVGIDCAATAKCGETSVDTVAGLVTLRNGSTDRQIAAGMDSGTGSNRLPQTSDHDDDHKKNRAALPFFLIIGGALAVILYTAFHGNDFKFGSNAVIVSTTR